MAQTGYTPIQLYYSTTAAAVPTSGNLLSGELAINIADGKLYFKNSSNVVTLIASSTSASSTADVTGPASSTDNAIVRFDGTTGKIIQNSGVTIDDSGNMVVSVNSATDALRITQTGAGNALLVEDSANPDSTPFVVDADGKVVAGYTARITGTAGASDIAVVGVNISSVLTQARYTNDSAASNLEFIKSRSTSVGQTVVQSGDNLGIIRASGSDGTAYIEAARITASVDGTPGTNDMPGRLVFSTTADGASSPTERMRIASTGAIGLSGANYGAAGEVLTSQGSSSPPVWATASSSTSIGLVRAIAINCILP